MKIVKPYPLSAMILWSLVIGNVGGAYLLIWKNLQLMGKPKEANKFLFQGGLILIILVILGSFISMNFNPKYTYYLSLSTSFSGIMWFNYKFLIPWQNETKIKSDLNWKTVWPIIGWSLLGILLTVSLSFLMGSLIKAFYITN